MPVTNGKVKLFRFISFYFIYLVKTGDSNYKTGRNIKITNNELQIATNVVINKCNNIIQV